MSAIDQLKDTLAEILRTIEHAADEGAKARRVINYMSQMKVGSDQWGNQTVSKEMKPWADRVNQEVRQRLVDEVERQNAIDLKQRAARLEALRAVLPSIAAQAAIEIGCKARELDHTADDTLAGRRAIAKEVERS
jgi:hypothetical protein